jgi:hypothetical protein
VADPPRPAWWTAFRHRLTAARFTGPVRVGPLGPVPGLSRLVQVYVRDLKDIADPARFALRREAAGPGGALFPALDADVTLAPAGEPAAALTLAGVYRPPLGAAAAALDRAVMRQIATATIRAAGPQAEAAGLRAEAAGPQAEAAGPDPSLLPPDPDTP